MTRVSAQTENLGKRLRTITKLFDLGERFREMDQFGDYRQIISLPNPPIEDIADGAQGLRLARIANDAMAELCAPASRSLCRLRRRGVAHRHRRFARGGRARHRTARRMRHPGVYAACRPAARRTGVRAAVRRDGTLRPADLAAPGPHRRDDRLSGRAEITLRDVVVFRLALRHLGRHEPAGLSPACSTAIPASRS